MAAENSEVLQALIRPESFPAQSRGVPGNNGPQQPPVGPLQMMASMNNQAQGAEKFADKVHDTQAAVNLATANFPRWVQEQVMSGLPSALTMMNTAMTNYQKAMQPTEYSGMENAMQALAGLSLKPELMQSGNLGMALGQMGMNATALRKDFETREQAKAKSMLDENQQNFKMWMDEAGKLITRGKADGAGILPNGNPYIKAGDRFYEIINNPKSERGYDLREIVSSTKGILSSDARTSVVKSLIEEELKTRKFANATEKENFVVARMHQLGKLVDEVAQSSSQAVVSPSAVTNAAKPGTAAAVSAPSATAEPPLDVTDKKPIGDNTYVDPALKIPMPDLSRLSPSERAAVQGQVEAAEKNPTPETLKRIEATFARLNQKYPSAVSAPAGSQPGLIDPAEEAGRKRHAEREAEKVTAASIKSEEAQGTAEGSRIGKKPEAINSHRDTMSSLDKLEEAVRGVMEQKNGLEWVHGPSGYVPYWGDIGSGKGTDAKNYKESLETLKNIIAEDTLKRMRAASATGGALGNVSDRDITLLQNSLAALSTDMSEEAIIRSYNSILRQIERMRRDAKESFLTSYPEGTGMGKTAVSTETGKVPETPKKPAFKVGETKVINGVTYYRTENGWVPK